MKGKNCKEIKNLEKRLICLEQKFLELRSDLDLEREQSMISDEPGNYYDIKMEIELIQREIEKTKRKIKAFEQMVEKVTGDLIEIGSKVKLENHKMSLYFNVVNAFEAIPAKGLISCESPVGRAILGKSVGEEVLVSSPSGNMPYIIKEIS